MDTSSNEPRVLRDSDEYETYLENVDEIENRMSDDSKFPVIEDGKVKILCKLIFEIIKFVINYLVNNTTVSDKKSYRTMFRCHQKENIIPSKSNQTQKILNCRMMNQQLSI